MPDDSRHDEDEAKLALLGRSARGLAHDLAGYMTAIGGFAELLSEEIAAGGNGQAELDEIRTAVERASRLIDSMLDFGETDSRDAERQQVSSDSRSALGRLGAIIRSVVEVACA